MSNPNLKRGAQKIFVNNPFHHDFVFETASYFSFKKLFFTAFDLVRIFFYAYVTIKVAMKGPQYLMFKRSNFLNHPDYMLIDENEYEKMKSSEKDKSI